MEEAHISIEMEHPTLENGLKINNMAMELKSGQMERNMKENMKWA